MKTPENFTRGDIPDDLFLDALQAAIAKKSSITISQILKHGGVSQAMIDKHMEQFHREGKKLRSRVRRPYVIIGWCVTLGGLGMSVYYIVGGIIHGPALAIGLAGVLLLAYLRD